MKFVAFAALIASASAAEAAAAKVCDADPVGGVGYDEAAACTTETADAAKKTKNAALVTALNTALKPYLDKCAAVPATGFTSTPAATHMKVTCGTDKLTFAYFSDDKCATAVTATAATYFDVKAGCTSKAWDGVATLASANADGSPSMKLTLKAPVDAKADATNAKAMGAAVAATTLAVAATLY